MNDGCIFSTTYVGPTGSNGNINLAVRRKMGRVKGEGPRPSIKWFGSEARAIDSSAWCMFNSYLFFFVWMCRATTWRSFLSASRCYSAWLVEDGFLCGRVSSFGPQSRITGDAHGELRLTKHFRKQGVGS